MKLFLDTAHVADIAQWVDTGLIDGVTTNPTNISKEKGDLKAHILAICDLLPHGDINVEVTQEHPQDVYKQACAIAALHPNIIVKIPCHAPYYPVIKTLISQGIRINITLVFTLLQGIMMSKLGVTYISPFVGRWDDIDVDGIPLLHDLRYAIDLHGYQTQILAASLRHLRHMHESVMAGAHVLTVPVNVFESALHHPLTAAGIAKFAEDWKKTGVKQFP